MSDTIYEKLTELVSDDQYFEAETLCRNALESEHDPIFWGTQLGYVCFLNESDGDSFYKRSLAAMQTVVEQKPEDTNARFWLGYYYAILLPPYMPMAIAELQHVLRLDSDHPYANLVLSGTKQYSEKENLVFLQRTLRQQPSNYRAATRAIGDLTILGRDKEAAKLFEMMRENTPYMECDYGIMNRYINGVFTAATIPQEEIAKAQKIIASKS